MSFAKRQGQKFHFSHSKNEKLPHGEHSKSGGGGRGFLKKQTKINRRRMGQVYLHVHPVKKIA